MLHVVLCQPEIPQNTGNIMRSCVGTNTMLHLIEPLGFKIDDTKLRRSAVDYYEYINYKTYKSWDEFIGVNKGRYYFLTRYGVNKHSNIDFSNINEDIYLIFGSESHGIDRQLLKDNINQTFRIPINNKLRSLNLSNCVAIMIYEALRQSDFKGLEEFEPDDFKGKDFLINNKEK